MNKIISACLVASSLHSMDQLLDEPTHPREQIPEIERIVRQYPAVTTRQPQARYNARSPETNERALDELLALCNELNDVIKQLDRNSDIRKAQQLLDEAAYKKNLLRCFIWLQRQAALAMQPPDPRSVPPLPAISKSLPLRWHNHPKMSDYLAHHSIFQ